MQDGKPLDGYRKSEVVSIETLEQVKNLLRKAEPPPDPPGGSHGRA